MSPRLSLTVSPRRASSILSSRSSHSRSSLSSGSLSGRGAVQVILTGYSADLLSAVTVMVMS